MIDSQDMNAVANMEEAVAAKNNSNTIAFAIGGAMLAVGAGLGYVFGTKKGVKKGEETAKSAMMSEIEGLKETISTMKEKAAS